MSNKKKIVKNRRKKGDVWVTTNRHLLGHSKKTVGRNPNFDMDETKLLIKLWGDPKVQRTLITTHKKHLVIKRLTEKMREYGYHRSVEEVNTRIKNLKCFYNRLKKDFESGVSPEEPSWKHFEAMDLIMTRRIFSVRPNEVAQPSLKYRQEQQQLDHEHHELNCAENTNKIKVVTTDVFNEEIDDGIIPDVEVDIDISDEALAVLASSHSYDNTKMVEINDDEKPLKCSIENYKNFLVIPKKEPIDVDGNDETLTNVSNNMSTNIGAFMPTLTEFLKNSQKNDSFLKTTSVSKNANTQNIAILPKTFPTGSSDTARTINQLNPITLGNPSLPAKSGPPTISLVPTNFLIRRQMQDAHQSQHMSHLQSQQPHHHVLCTQSNLKSNTGIVTTGPGGMKVLLVNTADKQESQKSVLTGSCVQAAIKNTKFIQHQPQLAQHTSSHQERTETVNSCNDNMTRSETLGLRNLINDLITIQKESNDIQRQQLELNQQRLQFEKTMAERVLSAFPALFALTSTDNSTTKTHAEPEKVNFEVKSDSSNPMVTNLLTCNGLNLLTPKVEVED